MATDRFCSYEGICILFDDILRRSMSLTLSLAWSPHVLMVFAMYYFQVNLETSGMPTQLMFPWSVFDTLYVLRHVLKICPPSPMGSTAQFLDIARVKQIIKDPSDSGFVSFSNPKRGNIILQPLSVVLKIRSIYVRLE